LEMIDIHEQFDRRGFTQDVSALVSRYHDMSGGRMAIGTALLDLTKLAYVHHVPVPSAMTLLGKAMLNLDGAIRVLSPELDPVQVNRGQMAEGDGAGGMGQLAGGRMFAWAIDMKHLVENAPRRADMILEKLATNQLTARLQINDVDKAVRGLNGAVNRL